MIKQFIIEYDTDTDEWDLLTPDIGADDPDYNELYKALVHGFDILEETND